MCSRNVDILYDLCRTREKDVYLVVKFLHNPCEISFQLHSDWECGSFSQCIPMTSEDFLHVACNRSFGRSRNVETLSRRDGGVLVMDASKRDDIIALNLSMYKRFRDLCRYIMEDIDLTSPYIGKEDALRFVNGRHTVKRLLFAYVRDLHERASYGFADKYRATETLRSASLQGFKAFLLRCGLICADDINIKTIVGDEDAFVAALITKDIPPTARLFIHYVRCELCTYRY